MSLAYPHTVTLWNKVGETGRKASWQRRTFDGVRWEETRGASTGTSGDASEDETLVLIPAVFSGYADPTKLVDGRTLGGAEWTLRKGDRIALGDSLAQIPPETASTVTKATAIRLGRSIHHFEVICA